MTLYDFLDHLCPADAKQRREPAYGHTEEARKRKIEQAKADGFEIIQSNSKTLLLDLDTPHTAKQFGRVLPIVDEHFGVAEVRTWRSKSGNGHAAVILKRPLPCIARLALQAALGSDGVREALALVESQNGVVEPGVLFKPLTGGCR